MDWFSGQQLAHSVLSCVYYLGYDDIPSDILKCFISIFGRILEKSRLMILSASVMFDEDFVSDTCGYLLVPDEQPDEQIEVYLSCLIDGLEKTIGSSDLISKRKLFSYLYIQTHLLKWIQPTLKRKQIWFKIN